MSVTISGDGRTTGLVGFRYVGTRYFESDGTFVKADPLGTGDIGLRAIRVTVIGGGGGSGGAGATGAGETSFGTSGGGGGWAIKFITDIAGLDASESVVRGAGGAGGAAGANNGEGGGTSSAFGVTATGGGFGFGRAAGTSLSMTRSGDGGVGSGGDINAKATPSSIGFRIGGGGNNANAGTPGSSMFGAASARQDPNAAVDETAPGGGSRGPTSRENTAARAGGAGANGIVIIDCFV